MENNTTTIVTKIIDHFSQKQCTGILLNGEDAIGKSHFTLNILIPALLKHEAQKRKHKRSKIIYISLNGLEDYSHIKHQILKQIKTMRGNFGCFAYSLKKLLGMRNDKTKLNCIKNSIIVFDELEKCNINLTHMLGYIDNFTYSNSLKTIIIANESNISKLYGVPSFNSRHIIKAQNSVPTQILHATTPPKQYATRENTLYNQLKNNLFGITINYQKSILD